MNYCVFNRLPDPIREPAADPTAVHRCQMERAYTRLQHALTEYTSLAEVKITKLEGDVSTRLYFRVAAPELSTHIKEPTLVAMVLPAPVPDAPLDFIDVGNYLHRLDLPVPRLYHYNREQGVLFLEDLQDCLLEACLQNGSETEKRAWYREAIDLLVELQVRTTRQPDVTCIAHRRAFDMAKFQWEMRRFRVYLLSHHFGHRIAPDDWAELARECHRLAASLCSEPHVLAHRDYHCRNIMVHRDRLCLIDFQDARLGPAQYDLVSLLRDSYAELSDELMEEMVEYYLTHPLRECLKCAKVPKVPKVSDDFCRIYDFATVERNMHATACFAWLNTDCGVSRYIQYIPRTLGTMRRALARQPELARLRAILARYVEELA